MACTVVCSLGLLTATGQAQVERIAAIVNDEVISTYDVEQRINLILSSSGIRPSQDIINRIQAQVVRSLIDEKLQLQEAEKYEVNIEPTEINDAINRLATQNKLRPSDLEASLKRIGIRMDTLRSQIEAELAWSKVVNGLLSPRVSVTQDEIDQVLNRLITTSNKPQYLVSEILLDIPTPSQEEEIRQGGLQLIRQMQQGAPFNVVAQQFSASASAGQGGDIGWVQDGELDEEINTVLRELRPGQISSPIRTASGFLILALRDRRVLGGADPLKAKVTLQQIMIPLSKNASADAADNAREKALAVQQALNGCGNIRQAAKKAGNAQVSSLGRIAMTDITGRFRTAVATLKAGEFSEPVRSDAGLHIMVVCDREDAEVSETLPSRDQIENRLYNQQLSMLARRHLRDLRRDATIEMR